MATIYENVYIGAFILALGHKMGREMPDAYPLASVNLYQQTPADALLGDLLANLSGLSLIVEFKRTWDNARSEHDKFWREESYNEVLRPGLRAMADCCHFLGFAGAVGGKEVTLRFCPYWTAWELLCGGSPPEQTREIEAFLQDILSGRIGVPTAPIPEVC